MVAPLQAYGALSWTAVEGATEGTVIWKSRVATINNF